MGQEQGDNGEDKNVKALALLKNDIEIIFEVFVSSWFSVKFFLF